MVSKVVVVALVALCCAQALAAPREDTMELESAHLGFNPIKCTQAVVKAVHIISDVTTTIKDYKGIISDAKKAKAACKTAEAATEETIKECVDSATTTEINKIIEETKNAGEKAISAVKEIKEVIDKCS